MKPAQKKRYEKIVDVIRDAGGKVVGRTRLQKLSYFLEAAGLGEGFHFEYRHYGPYSEDVAAATRVAEQLNMLTAEECSASWGGTYFVFSVPSAGNSDSVRAKLSSIAVSADAIELELAATALFLFKEGHKDPWRETARRKPEKAAAGRLEKAKRLYDQIRDVRTPAQLPRLN